MTLTIRVSLDGDDDLGIEERGIDLPPDTPVRFGATENDDGPPDAKDYTLYLIARGSEYTFAEAGRSNRPRWRVWLTAEQSQTGEATWWDCEVEPLWAQCERLRDSPAERPP